MKAWKKGDVAFLETRRGYMLCTIVDASDPDTVLIDYEALYEPVRVARARLRK